MSNGDDNNYKYLLFYLSILNILDPTLNEAFFYKAKIYELSQNYSKAEFFYNKIDSKHTLYIDSQINTALNKRKQGHFFEGEKHLKQLINDYKNKIIFITALADFYRLEKKYDKAVKFYTKSINFDIESNNIDWRLFYLRGICFERLGNWDMAENDFLHSLKINPRSPEVLNYLAYGWLERDININKSMKMLEEAYKSNPESFYIADSLAWAYFKRNELKKALFLMEKVIIMAPGEAISLLHMADIYHAMDRKREAAFYWKQALDLAQPEDNIIDKLIKKLEIYDAG